MSDLISRQAAIDCEYQVKIINDIEYVMLSEVQMKMRKLPSADRPQGEWIEQEDDYHHYWECSECGMGVGLDDIRNYCPNCGARMKGADDEHDK